MFSWEIKVLVVFMQWVRVRGSQSLSLMTQMLVQPSRMSDKAKTHTLPHPIHQHVLTLPPMVPPPRVLLPA